MLIGFFLVAAWLGLADAGSRVLDAPAPPVAAAPAASTPTVRRVEAPAEVPVVTIAIRERGVERSTDAKP